MKNLSLIVRKIIYLAAGKALTLLGIVASLSACLVKYGPGPDTGPYYWSDHAPEQQVGIRSSLSSESEGTLVTEEPSPSKTSQEPSQSKALL